MPSYDGTLKSKGHRLNSCPQRCPKIDRDCCEQLRTSLNYLLASCDGLEPPTHLFYFFFFFNDTATTEIYTLSLHDALPILPSLGAPSLQPWDPAPAQKPP